MIAKMPAENGTVNLGTNLQVAYFDQNRDQLDDDATILDNVSDGNDFVQVAGQKKHIISHLKDFLFSIQPDSDFSIDQLSMDSE